MLDGVFECEPFVGRFELDIDSIDSERLPCEILKQKISINQHIYNKKIIIKIINSFLNYPFLAFRAFELDELLLKSRSSLGSIMYESS